MPRAQFSAELIDQLKIRCQKHNELAKSLGLPLVRLQSLKDIYSRGYKRSNPAERAMRKVDEHLASLAGTATLEKADSNRDDKGRFAPGKSVSARVPLPRTEAEHEALQNENAGYSALTSEIVPDHRHEVAARVLTLPALGLASTLALASIYRGKRLGVVRMGARGAGYGAGYAAGHLTGSLGLRAKIGAKNVARRVVDKPAEPVDAHEFRERVSEIRGKAARGTANIATGMVDRASKTLHRAIDAYSDRDPQGAGLRAFDRTMAATGDKMQAARASVRAERKARFEQNAHRAAALGLAAVTPAVIANYFVGDKVRDAAAAIDAVGYRRIQKALLESEGAEALMKKVANAVENNASDAEMADALAKSVFPLSPAYAKLVTAGVGAVGAGAGVGVRHLVHRVMHGPDEGNTYHDAKGRFTSRDQAVQHHAITGLSAVLGGGLAAAGTLLALRHANVASVLRRAAPLKANLVKEMDLIARAAVDKDGKLVPPFRADHHKEIYDMYVGRPGIPGGNPGYPSRDMFISNHVKNNSAAQKRIAEIEASGGQDATSLKERVRKIINDKIAETLSEHDAMQVPDKGGHFKPLSAINEAGAKTNKSPTSIAKERLDRVRQFIESGSDEKIEKATANLDPSQKAAALDLLRNRAKKLDGVDEAIKLHAKKLSQAQAVREKAKAAFEEAHAKTAAKGDKATQADFERIEKARAAKEAAADVYDGVADDGPFVEHPTIPGTVLPGKDYGEIERMKRDTATNATKAAARAYAKAFMEHKQRLMTDAAQRHTRIVAAEANLLSSYGRTFNMPKHLRELAKAVKAPHAAFNEARAKVLEADRAVAVAEGEVNKAIKLRDRAKAAKKNRSEAAIAAATDAVEAARKVVDERIAERAQHELEATRLYAPYVEVVAKYEAGLKAAAGRRHASKLGVLDYIMRDHNRMKRAGGAAVDKFLKSPTGENLKAVAETVKSARDKVMQFGKNTAKQSFDDIMMTNGALNAGRILRSGAALSAIGATGLGAYEYGGAVVHAKRNGKNLPPLPSHLRARELVRYDIDPLTGAGYASVVLPDPNEPARKIVVWGERYKGHNSAAERLPVGTNYAQLVKRFQEEKAKQQNGQNGDLEGAWLLGQKANPPDGLANKVRGVLSSIRDTDHISGSGTDVALTFRKPGGDQKLRDASEALNGHLAKALNGNSPQRRQVLQAVFSNEGRLLTKDQAFQLLTGYDNEGKRRHTGALGEGKFGGNVEQVEDALQNAIERSSQEIARGDADAARFHKAITLVGNVKKLDSEARERLHEIVAAAREGRPVGEKAPEPAAHEARGFDATFTETPRERQEDWGDYPIDTPEHWGGDALFNEKLARELNGFVQNNGRNHIGIHQRFGATKTYEKEALQNIASQIALLAATSDKGMDHKLSPLEAVITARSVLEKAAETHGDDNLKHGVLSGLFDPSPEDIDQALDETLARRRHQKAHMLDDLAKAADAFMRDGLRKGLADRAVGEVLDATAEQATKNRSQGAKRGGQSLFNPSRVAHDVGNIAGGELAWQAADRFLPKAIGFVAPELGAAANLAGAAGTAFSAARRVGRAAAAVGTRGARFAATSAAAAGGQAAADHLTSKALHYNPKASNPGEQIGEAVGQGVGALGALALAPSGIGVLGSAAIGTAGSYAGGLVGRGVYDVAHATGIDKSIGKWFSGYDKPSVARATKHMRAPGVAQPQGAVA